MERRVWLAHSYRKGWAKGAFGLGLILLGLLVVVHFRQNRNALAQQSASPYARQALALCKAFSGTGELTGPPQYWEANVRLEDGSVAHRNLWAVPCVAYGRHYTLGFNTLNGDLCFVFGESRRERGEYDEPPVAPISTPIQAAEVALQRLRQLNLVPLGAKIVLREKPHTMLHDDAWEVNWNVRRPDRSAPTRIRLVLDRIGGMPLTVTDYHTLQQYASQ